MTAPAPEFLKHFTDVDGRHVWHLEFSLGDEVHVFFCHLPRGKTPCSEEIMGQQVAKIRSENIRHCPKMRSSIGSSYLRLTIDSVRNHTEL